MKQIKNMSQVELAAYVQERLLEEGIVVILSGGTAASFYSKNKYVSKDLDLLNTGFATGCESARIKSLVKSRR